MKTLSLLITALAVLSLAACDTLGGKSKSDSTGNSGLGTRTSSTGRTNGAERGASSAVAPGSTRTAPMGSGSGPGGS